MDGIDYIVRERIEQKVIHGYTVAKDAKYKHQELETLAKYLLTTDNDDERNNLADYLFFSDAGPRMSIEFYEKLKNKSKFNRLIIAGALIAAQLDTMIYKLKEGPDENLPK